MISLYGGVSLPKPSQLIRNHYQSSRLPNSWTTAYGNQSGEKHQPCWIHNLSYSIRCLNGREETGLKLCPSFLATILDGAKPKDRLGRSGASIDGIKTFSRRWHLTRFLPLQNTYEQKRIKEIFQGLNPEDSEQKGSELLFAVAAMFSRSFRLANQESFEAFLSSDSSRPILNA